MASKKEPEAEKKENASKAEPKEPKIVTETVLETDNGASSKNKVDVSFYLLKNRKWRTLINTTTGRIEISGENSVVTVKASDPYHDLKVEFLRNHKGNQKSGGTDFVELTDGDERPGGSCLLDSLLDLSKDSLLNVLSDNDPKNRVLSRGAIMMLILKEKGSA